MKTKTYLIGFSKHQYAKLSSAETDGYSVESKLSGK